MINHFHTKITIFGYVVIVCSLLLNPPSRAQNEMSQNRNLQLCNISQRQLQLKGLALGVWLRIRFDTTKNHPIKLYLLDQISTRNE